jgi:hypothetical protein
MIRAAIRAATAAAVVLLLHAATVMAQPAAPPQTQEDDYTRYELQAPGSGQFRILYEVTATRAGAPSFFNAIRKGSVATDEHVFDAATGQPLKWEVVSGARARAEGHPLADLDTEWIKVHLARPVPANGEARVVIDKTYKDDKSYFRRGELIVFDRSLGIRRNAVVLPSGYRLVSCNVPSQVLATSDGRVMITFQNPGPAAAPLVVTAAPGLAPFTPAWPTQGPDTAWTGKRSPPDQLVDRAHQDHEAIYRLGAPETHTWEVERDYTERTVGETRYLHLFAGDGATPPIVRNLDTGATLALETATAADVNAPANGARTSDTNRRRVLVARFPSIRAGESIRLRVTDTMTNSRAYALDGDELVFDQSVDFPRQTVLLPPGWTTVASAMPGVIDETADGRQRLVFENPRPDTMQLLIRARRR